MDFQFLKVNFACGYWENTLALNSCLIPYWSANTSLKTYLTYTKTIVRNFWSMELIHKNNWSQK